MNLNTFSHAESEFSHVVHLLRNHIAEENFVNKFVISVSNSHKRLGTVMPKYGRDLTSHAKYGAMKHMLRPALHPP